VAERDCRDCKRWKGCPGKWYSYTENGKNVEEEWYSYRDIRWCPMQIIWIYQCADIFRAGNWVERHEESGESKQLHAEAYFVKSGIAISELDDRAKGIDDRAELLITQIEDGRTLVNLSDGARAQLMYLKGKDRKKINFKRWRREVWESSKTGKKHRFS